MINGWWRYFETSQLWMYGYLWMQDMNVRIMNDIIWVIAIWKTTNSWYTLYTHCAEYVSYVYRYTYHIQIYTICIHMYIFIHFYKYMIYKYIHWSIAFHNLFFKCFRPEPGTESFAGWRLGGFGQSPAGLLRQTSSEARLLAEKCHGWMVMVDGYCLVRWNEKTHNIYIYYDVCIYIYIYYDISIYIFFVFIPIHSYTGYTYNYQCSMIYVCRCMMLNDSYSDIIWTAFEWHYICCCFKHPWMIVLERTVGVMLQPIHWSDQAWGVWIWEFHTEHWLNWI